jgi:hypothetical protein
MSSLGRLIYEGPSLLDGKPIFVVAIPTSYNRKTGPMLQTYIMRSDMPPVLAVNEGEDYSICGDCPMRGNIKERTCYVNLGHGPSQVYKYHQKHGYRYCNPLHLFKGFPIRIGTYGDPAAVPSGVWQALLQGTDAHTGYTHSYHRAPWLKGICMASTETESETKALQSQGWKTFRVRARGAPLMKGEVDCPADKHHVHCTSCRLCTGNKVNVSIEVHGFAGIPMKFEKRIKR